MIFKPGRTYYHKGFNAYFYVDSVDLHDKTARVFVKEPDLVDWRIINIDVITNALDMGYKRHKGSGIKKLSRMFGYA
jgi:hypothetical protein